MSRLGLRRRPLRQRPRGLLDEQRHEGLGIGSLLQQNLKEAAIALAAQLAGDNGGIEAGDLVLAAQVVRLGLGDEGAQRLVLGDARSRLANHRHELHGSLGQKVHGLRRPSPLGLSAKVHYYR